MIGSAECFPTNFLPFNGLFYTTASDSFNAISGSDDVYKGTYMVNAIYMCFSVQNLYKDSVQVMIIVLYLFSLFFNSFRKYSFINEYWLF